MTTSLTAWPFDSIDTTESQYSTLMSMLQENGITDAPTSSTGQVTAGSGFTVNVAAIASAFIAGAVVQLGSPGTVTLDPPSAQARVDRVVLRVDWTQNLAVLDKKTGVPGAGAPPLSTTVGGVYEISLAQVAVPAGALNLVSGNITDERSFVSGRLRKWTASTRPAGTAGLVGFNYSTKLVEYHNGTTWKSLDLSSTAWSTLTGVPATFPPSAHTHDDRYYQKGEVDSKLGGYIPDAVNSVGQTNLPFRIAGGSTLMTPTGGAAPYTVTKHIAFPVGRFTAPPAVLTGINTTADTDSFTGAANITTAGFDLFFKRDDKTDTTVFWLAYDSVNS